MAASMIRWWLRAVVVYTLLGAAVIHAAQARSHDEGVGRVDPGSVSPYPWGLVGVEQGRGDDAARSDVGCGQTPVSDLMARASVRRVPTLLSVARPR
jgi:hypothetical protein